MKITDNTILITGGTAGIGREFVDQFYNLNNKIIVASRNTENLKELKNEYPKIEIITCNLSKLEDVKSLIRNCLENHEEINVIVNNAGVQFNNLWIENRNGFDQIAEETTINFISPMQIIHGLTPLLIDKKESAIINISSAVAFAPKMSAPIYCGTKAAIHASTKALRYQFEKTPVKVFEIIPPLVDTNMTRNRGTGKMSPEQLVKKVLAKLRKDKYEISIGKARLLRLIQRFYPKGADNLLKNG